MDQQKQIIELMKEVKFTPFPDGGGLDVSVKHQLPDHAFEAIADHLLANGVIVLPCKVGDEIFFIRHISNAIPDFISDDVVTKIGVTTRGIMHEVGVDFADFGKTVFLTKEAAEQALKEREN